MLRPCVPGFWIAVTDWQAAKQLAEDALVEIITEQRPRTISYDGRTVELFDEDRAEKFIALCDRMLAREAGAASSGGDVSYADI